MSAHFWFLLLAFLVADLMLLPPILMRARRQPMDAATRATAPGQFAKLGDGDTHFQWHGPKDGPVLVLIHGLTVPSFVFDALVPPLTQAGFRILRYDLYGRGFSERPPFPQDAALFVDQLDGLLADQGVSQSVALLGYSMGGAIAAHYAKCRPEKVSGLVLLASAGFKHRKGALMRFIVAVPVIGNWLMTVFGAGRLRASIAAEDMSESVVPQMKERMLAETEYRGYLKAILSSLRHLLKKPLDGLHGELAAEKIPTLAIWAAADQTVLIESAERLAAANPAVETRILPGLDHALAYTRPDLVAEEVVRFLAPKEA